MAVRSDGHCATMRGVWRRLIPTRYGWDFRCRGGTELFLTYFCPSGGCRKLAWHLANTDVQFMDGIADLKFTMAARSEAEKPKTLGELVDWYDRNMKRSADRVHTLTADQLLTPVQFFTFNLPAAFYLGFLNNHSIHHRGELATYLRPMGSKVPSIYGGSFDEPLQAAA